MELHVLLDALTAIMEILKPNHALDVIQLVLSALEDWFHNAYHVKMDSF